METFRPKNVKNVVVRFSGDSGDGIQLTGNLFSNLVAIFGNQIATHPDFPSEIRAPHGTLSGVSGFQVKLGSSVFNSGDEADVLVAMNPAALKVCAKDVKKNAVIIVDSDAFDKKNLEKAVILTEDPFDELGLKTQQILTIPISSLTKESLSNFPLDSKDKLRSKNMFALGIVCWLFGHRLEDVNQLLEKRFQNKQTILEANEKVLFDGYNYAHNQHLNISTYRVETSDLLPGHYIDMTGNQATAWGLVAASEKSGRPLFLGSYPITPATDILHELVKLKFLGVKAIQAEDEIAAATMSIGAAFAGNLAATSTSGPGLALKSEALGLAVMAELPLVVIDVQRGGPSTGMPTKSEQTDLLQAMYGRNGEAPLVVLAAKSPCACFDMSYWASKLAMEFMTPVILLTDGYIANGSASWRIPFPDELLPIVPHDISLYDGDDWKLALRDEETYTRYWVKVGIENKQYRLGGLENHIDTGEISTDPQNHQQKTEIRRQKIENIANHIPPLEVEGYADADTLIIGWGGTYGHLLEAVNILNQEKPNLAFSHFSFIYPFPLNTKQVLSKYKNIVVVEQNEGQFVSLLKTRFHEFHFSQYNKVEGQPFSLEELIRVFRKYI